MKRLDSLLIILLVVIFIVYALSERLGLSATAVSVPQQEIIAKLNELDNRVAALQADLERSKALLKECGQLQ
jgi:hypothetical protein